ncbi:YcjF family protein [Candidatus Riflebacteria bacterium]
MSQKTDTRGIKDLKDETNSDAEILNGRPRPKKKRAKKKETTAQEKISKGKDAQPSYHETTGDRPGDSLMGRPILSPKKLAETDKKIVAKEGKTEVTIDKVLVQKEIPHSPVLFNATFLIFFLAALSILILFIFSQSLNMVVILQNLPWYFSISGWLLIFLCLSLTVFSMIRVLSFYYSLGVNRQISFQQIKHISTSEPGSEIIYDRIREELSNYLKIYEVDSSMTATGLKKLGLEDEDLKKLLDARAKLLSPRPIDGYSWLAEFENEFQKSLDDIAEKRISAHAWRVAIATATSPFAFLDMWITFYHSFTLLGDLCLIYNRRMNKYQTFYILGWVFVDSYFAGEFQELTEETSHGLFEHMGEDIPGLVGPLAGKISAKLGEGTINYLFTRRLGRKSATLLRPLLKD